MHIRLLAVGDRQPSWVEDAFGIYCRRFPREWKFRVDIIPAVRRGKNDKSHQALAAEGDQILSKLGAKEQVVLLDERGRQLTSKSLAARLSDWQSDARDLCFVIGGPDGLSPEVLAEASMKLSLSDLTFPHTLAKVMLVEQLYRAWTILKNHPYHRA